MPFPQTPRVIYAKNPLQKVICQWRFPPILRIDSEIPSAFQEAIIAEYPLYVEKPELQSDVRVALMSDQAPDIARQLASTTLVKNHEFSSEDGVWKVNLARTFLAITTTVYSRWEEFESKFRSSYEALLQIYTPPFFTRIGLRYIDVFQRSKLGLEQANWSELLQPYFLGLLSSSVSNRVNSLENTYEVSLEDERSIVRIATSFAQDASTQERCFLVDSDFYVPGKTLLEEAGKRLDFLHMQATRLIRWMITDKLHAAMEPHEI